MAYVNAIANRNNPYNFDAYLEKLEKLDYYLDDPWLQKVLKHFAGEDLFAAIEPDIRRVSELASNKWRKLADASARLEERPYLLQYDGHRRRIDRLVRPGTTLELEEDTFGEGIYRDGVDIWTRFTKMFLFEQNGEAGIACPLVCTEGLINAIEVLGASHPEVKKIMEHCKNGINGKFAIGSQFISEIQSGSDVPENVLEAEPQEDGTYKLYGTKYFCSACHADYTMITAKPTGSTTTALFVMPMWLPGNKEKEIRNGYTIDKIKWKIGTAELPTCELSFNGAVCYQVGPLDKGVSNLIAHILTLSRLVVAIGSAANMARPIREAKLYANFREVFGQPISEFALVDNLLEKNEYIYKRTLAGAFKIYGHFCNTKGKEFASISPENKRKQWVARELVLLQKLQTSADATFVIRDCMSVFGGYGAIEDVSILPRLYRDACVHELWEGPKNVLLAQMYRDLRKQESWYPIDEFVADLLAGGEQDKIDAFAKELKILVDYKNLDRNDPETKVMAARYEKLAEDMIHYYQDIAYSEVANG